MSNQKGEYIFSDYRAPMRPVEALAALTGQVFRDIRELDKGIISESTNLRRKSDEFRNNAITNIKNGRVVESGNMANIDATTSAILTYGIDPKTVNNTQPTPQIPIQQPSDSGQMLLDLEMPSNKVEAGVLLKRLDTIVDLLYDIKKLLKPK